MNRYHPDSWFLAIARIVEERIEEARREGLFENLPGSGKPLKLDDDSKIAPHLRVSYRILKNAGILPPEMQLRKEISQLREVLSETECEEDARQMVREINEKILALKMTGGALGTAGMDEIYADRILERLRSKKARLLLEKQPKR